MEINEHILSLTGKATLPQQLELGYEYIIIATGEIVSITDSNNSNGTKDRKYKFVPILCSIQSENGLVLKGKMTSSVSTMIRSSLSGMTKIDSTHNFDPEEVYQEYGRWFIENKHEIYTKIIKRLET